MAQCYPRTIKVVILAEIYALFCVVDSVEFHYLLVFDFSHAVRTLGLLNSNNNDTIH
jgi:hypothetical protein